MGWVGAVCGQVSNKTRHYFHYSSIQGLRYITEPGRNLTERVFWIAVCFLSLLGTYKLLMASWYNFQNNAVSFVVETSHLDWNTSFASISVCESDSPDKIFETGNKLFGNERNMNMDFYLRDIAFFDGTCYSCKTHCNRTMNCTSDLQHLISYARASCERFLRQCSWNGESFDCCSHFLPLATETGQCFTLNSLHTTTKGKKMKFISNRFTGPGRLDLMVFEAAKLFVHSPEDVPYINHPQEEKAVLNWGTLFTLLYQVNEISNDPLLKDVSVHQRNCRFPEENTLEVYNYYSYSACVVDCRAKAQIRFCNCTHHFMPKMEGVPTCTIEGLICLTDHSEILRALKVKDSEKKGLVCDCKSSCLEPEYTVLIKQQEPNEDYPSNMSDYGSVVSVVMDALPSQRFRRNVVRTRLDLVVSMGGTAGLFLGASILSIAELLVFMLLRNEAQAPTAPQENRVNKAILSTRPKHNVNNSSHLLHKDKVKKIVFPPVTKRKVYPFLY